MSKYLRTFLLSALIIVLAVSSVMAAETEITFRWTGDNGSYWGDATNWLPSVSYDAVSGDIVKLNNSIEYYPGNIRGKSDSFDIFVVISKDATISMTRPGGASSSVGGLVGIKSIDIVGTSSTQPAIVTLDMGANSWFENTPSITVRNSRYASLRINGSHDPVFKIVKPTKWEGINANLALYFPVSYENSNAHLSLDVTGSTLTIGNATLLGNATNGDAFITADGLGAVVVFDVDASSTGRYLDIHLKNGARTINVASGKAVTLNVYSDDKFAVSADSDTFVKNGAGTLTLNRAERTNIQKSAIPVSVEKINVNAGTLIITGNTYAPLGYYDATAPTFSVASGATLDLGAGSVSTDQQVQFVISGEVLFRNGAIDVNDRYTGGELKTDAKVSADVREGGVLHFYGSQAVEHLRGKGKIMSSGTESILVLNGKNDSADIKDFTGTIQSLDVGIASSWSIIPFLTKAARGSSINNLYVFGPNGELTLDSDNLDGIDGLNETNVYLRSSIPGATKNAQLSRIAVGKLNISGDVALGTVSVDGTLSADGTGVITLQTKATNFTAEKLVLHANANKDFNASGSGNKNEYVGAYAVDIVGPGTFIPKLMVNGTTDDIHVGGPDSIYIRDGATVVINEGVKFPTYNSLLLSGASLDVANDTYVYGNFVINGASRLRVYLNDQNNRTFEGDPAKNAITVNGMFKLDASKLSVDIKSLEDGKKFLGKRYAVVGYESYDITPENASIDLIGEYTKEAGTADDAFFLDKDAKGIYAQMINWFIQPVVDPDWNWIYPSDGMSGFGSGSTQFAAWIGYGLSDDISPDITELLSVGIRVEGSSTVVSNGDTRKRVIDDATKKDIAFLSVELSQDKSQTPVKHKIILSGTSYKTSLDIRINVTWPTTWTTAQSSVLNGAKITEKVSTGGSLGRDGEFNAHNAPVVARDLVDLLNVKRVLKNDDKESGNDTPNAEPFYADVEVTPTSAVVFKAEEDARFEFRVDGITKITNESSLPVWNGSQYVWNNRDDSDANAPYSMTISGDTFTLTDLVISVDGKPIAMDTVEITQDGSGIKVSIPVSLLGGTSGTIPEVKSVELTAKADDGRTVHLPAQTVTLIPATYIVGTPAQSTYTFTEGKIAADNAQTVTTGELENVTFISSDIPAWLHWNVDRATGAIGYSIDQNTAPGNYDITVYAYNGTTTYGYTFAIVVAEGFRVRVDEPYTDYYENTNYVAIFTTSNAPEGVVEWTTSTLPAWATATRSGDAFVVFGQLPFYDNSDYDEVDPNEVSFTVTATVAGESQTATINFTVAEDTDETREPAADAVTSTGDIYTADRNYSVTINYTNEDDYGSEIDDFNLPYWLVAASVLGGEDGDEVRGYTISFRTGAEVARDAKGVVRYTNPAGDIIQWSVTFNDDTTVAPEALSIAATPNTLTLAAGATQTVTMSAPNAIGAVSYTTDQSWAVVNENTITITAPAASAVVTVTGTDAGRTESADATTTITVTVTGGGNQPGGSDNPGGSDEPGSGVPVITVLTALFSNNNTDSVDVQADRDIPEDGWAVYVNGELADWAAIIPTGARTATVTLDAPSSLAEGTYAITVTATDANGTSTPMALGSFTVESSNNGGSDEPNNGGSDEPNNVNDNNPGGSSGGCDAGFGAMALAFAAPLFLRRRRS